MTNLHATLYYLAGTKEPGATTQNLLDRICSHCQQDKPEDAFNFKNRRRGIRHGKCKECVQEYSAQHYQENRPAYIARAYRNARVKRKQLHRKIVEYLTAHPCVDCGESDPIVLEFDHRDESAKLMTINRLKSQCYSWEMILREIDKCDVRCANCHRRRTAKQFGWEAFYLSCLPHNDASNNRNVPEVTEAVRDAIRGQSR